MLSILQNRVHTQSICGLWQVWHSKAHLTVRAAVCRHNEEWCFGHLHCCVMHFCSSAGKCGFGCWQSGHCYVSLLKYSCYISQISTWFFYMQHLVICLRNGSAQYPQCQRGCGDYYSGFYRSQWEECISPLCCGVHQVSFILSTTLLASGLAHILEIPLFNVVKSFEVYAILYQHTINSSEVCGIMCILSI